MLFNSYIFILVFVPAALLGYYLIGKSRVSRLGIVWLIGASLLFYGLFNVAYLALITGSILVNYTAGRLLAFPKLANQRKLLLIGFITINILVLGYFKYTNFFIDNINALFASDFHLNTIFLPLAISFFTLQQISYLVDTYHGENGKHDLLDYSLFVTFFPKLISGPIIRFREMFPQIVENHIPRLNARHIAVGITVLLLGLFKKVVIADSIGAYADIVFNTVAAGSHVTFIDSWIGALTYTLQLYFDFSGYCDMAIGLGVMFGIRLPLNFYSPYKATSIIDFWHRWHMTFSSFLRDYLYIPLGGNRRGFLRQVTNLMIVMIIAGLWHGAGWTFIIWGALHGFYLVINHSWRKIRRKTGKEPKTDTWWRTSIAILITFIALTVAWVFFRADNPNVAIEIIKGMTGLNGIAMPTNIIALMGPLGRALVTLGITVENLLPGVSLNAAFWTIASLSICWFLPNVQEYMSNQQASLDKFTSREIKYNTWLRWRPSFWHVAVVSLIGIYSILSLSHVSRFIYFRF